MSILGLKCSKSRGKSVVFDLGKSVKSKRIIATRKWGVEGMSSHLEFFLYKMGHTAVANLEKPVSCPIT